VGVIHSDDPAVKLNQAHDLIMRGRDFPAQRLIQEASAIYKKNGDLSGMGQAKLEEGIMFANDYRDYHFPNTARQQPEHVCSSEAECASRGIEHMKSAVSLFGSANDVYASTTAYLQLAMLYGDTGDKNSACHSYDMSNKFYHEAKKKDASHTIYVPEPFNSSGGWDAFIKYMKGQVPCS